MNRGNLALRGLLELAALAGYALFALGLADGLAGAAAAIAALVLAAAVWAVFAVPGDPSRSGNAPVPVPGRIRLILELAILFGGAIALGAAGHGIAAIVLAGLIVLHYLLSRARIAWLLER